jgi:hypothetical protein
VQGPVLGRNWQSDPQAFGRLLKNSLPIQAMDGLVANQSRQ